ncbi:MAG: hypothetical protein IPI32_04065 [Austwickia sp.]|nr:hypothetical protein [Austwickia sp.]MBK8436804.1 hypothetical protein [Austwickia sp.]MBK9100434.1 hypothetical protein [Austwickia sp.]
MMPHRKDALTPELSGSLPGRTSAPDTRAPRRAGTVAFVATLALTGALAVTVDTTTRYADRSPSEPVVTSAYAVPTTDVEGSIVLVDPAVTHSGAGSAISSATSSLMPATSARLAPGLAATVASLTRQLQAAKTASAKAAAAHRSTQRTARTLATSARTAATRARTAAQRAKARALAAQAAKAARAARSSAATARTAADLVTALTTSLSWMTQGGPAATAPTPTIATLTKQLNAAKIAAAKADAAYAKAQATAKALAKAATMAATQARTSAQRARARVLIARAAAAAKQAAAAKVSAKASATAVDALKKTIDTINRAADPKPVTPTDPSPVAPVKPAEPTAPVNPVSPVNPAPVTPDPAPVVPPVTSSDCESLAQTFRPITVTSNWRVSCVDSFPGISVGAGYTVLGLTRYDTGQGIADVMVLRTLTGAQLTATFAHELSHAYSITSMNSTQRAAFVTRIRTASLTTATEFFPQNDDDYDGMPAEIWARTQARCVGYGAPKKPFTEATCPDVDAAIAIR